jgi:hypothetical protein
MKQGLTSLRQNSILEGHGFSRAVTNTGRLGFSSWGTFLLTSEFSYALGKRCPQGLKPGRFQAIMARLKPCPSRDRVFSQTLRLARDLQARQPVGRSKDRVFSQTPRLAQDLQARQPVGLSKDRVFTRTPRLAQDMEVRQPVGHPNDQVFSQTLRLAQDMEVRRPVGHPKDRVFSQTLRPSSALRMGCPALQRAEKTRRESRRDG